MKSIFLYALVSFFSFASIQLDDCTLEIEKEQLLESDIILSCDGYNNGSEVIIEEFTIKFPGYPSEKIKTGALNMKTRSYLKEMNQGYMVVIFDIIKAKDQTGKPLKEVPAFTLVIK